jgi:hypothetical protein
MLKRIITAGTIAAAFGVVGAGTASAMPQAQCQVPQYQLATAGPKVDIANVGQVNENVGSVTFKVSLSSAPTKDVTVNVCTADGSTSGRWAAVSSAGGDYVDVDTTLTFRPAHYELRRVCSTPQQPGQICTQYTYTSVWVAAETVRYVSVRINDDGNDEPEQEDFQLRARSATNAGIRTGAGTATILDNDWTLF